MIDENCRFVLGHEYCRSSLPLLRKFNSLNFKFNSFRVFIAYLSDKELPYFKKLIRKGFSLFISNQIEQFSDCRDVPLHFIGSIGFYLKDELTEVLESKKMNIGKVLRKPIDGLVSYHLENI